MEPEVEGLTLHETMESVRPKLRLARVTSELREEETARERDVFVGDGQLRVNIRDGSSRACDLTGTVVRKGSLNARCPVGWDQVSWELFPAPTKLQILRGG